MSLRFRPAEHLKSQTDFRRVFDRKRSVSDATLIVYACENGLAFNRLGMSVSRKAGNAVVRNRLRRLFREAFRLTKAELPTGFDLIVLPRAGAGKPTLDGMKESFRRLISQAARRLAKDAGKPAEPTEQSPS